MKRELLTVAKIKATKPKEERYLVADGRGLYLQVFPSGVKSWCVRYRRNGKPMKITIGRWPHMNLEQARKQTERMKPTLFDGMPETTVRQFGARYMREIVQRHRKDPDIISRYLDRDVYPAIGDKAIAVVVANDLRAIVFAKRDLGHLQAALILRDLLKRLFDYAIVCGLVSANPTLAIPRKLIATPHSRARFLSRSEIGQFICSIEGAHLKPRIHAALQLLLLTLVRKSELMLARWKHINFNEREWIIPADHSKTNTEHVVYLSAQAVRLLESLAARVPGKQLNSEHLVFSHQWSTSQPMSESTLNRVLERACSDMEHFTIHDLRRTGATHLAEAEYPSDVIEKALNHAIGGVRGVYNRAQYKEQRRAMLQAWADKIDDYALDYRMSMRRASEKVTGPSRAFSITGNSDPDLSLPNHF